MENFGKTAVFPGGYGRIGEIPRGRIWPDWGLKGARNVNNKGISRNYIVISF